MNIRFRGGPKHNKSHSFRKLEQHIFMAEYIPPSFKVFEENDRNCEITKVKYTTHKYQLGKDKNGKQFYFYVGV